MKPRMAPWLSRPNKLQEALKGDVANYSHQIFLLSPGSGLDFPVRVKYRILQIIDLSLSMASVSVV